MDLKEYIYYSQKNIYMLCMRLILYYLEEKQKAWVRSGSPKGISFIASLIEGFFEHWGPGFR